MAEIPGHHGVQGARTSPRGGSLMVVHRASNDLRLNVHYHALFLDGAVACVLLAGFGVASCYCAPTGRDQCAAEFGVRGQGLLVGVAPPFEIDSCNGTSCGTATITVVPSGGALSDGSAFSVSGLDAGTEQLLIIWPPWGMTPGATAEWSITVRAPANGSSASASRHVHVVELIRNCGNQHCAQTDVVDFGRLTPAP